MLFTFLIPTFGTTKPTDLPNIMKYALGTTLAIFAIIALQLFWLQKMYRSHVSEFEDQMETCFTQAIEKEVLIRKNDLLEKRLSDSQPIRPDEIKNLVGDSTDIATIKKKKRINSISEGITQLFQMLLLKQGSYPQADKLDSLYQKGMKEKVRHCICLYDKQQILDHAGDTTLLASSHSLSTPPIPIGTQDRFYLRLFSEKPSADIFRQMTYAVLLSAALAVLVMGCLVWQFLVILRKDLLLKQREAAVNGTVHDLKTPLAGVVTLVGWLKKEEKDSQKQAFLQQAEERLKRLRNDIERILTAARGGRRKLVLHKEPTDLPTLLAQAAADTRACLPAKRHTLETDNRLADGQVEADPACLRNVFAQLLENALKYSDEGVRITVKLEEDAEGWVTVSVTDNGWGIPRKCLKKLFGEYYQVPREEGRAQKGYGIGLTYARYVVRAHGGDIRVESREGTGSTFSIRLPRRQTNRP